MLSFHYLLYCYILPIIFSNEYYFELILFIYIFIYLLLFNLFLVINNPFIDLIYIFLFKLLIIY